MPFHANRLIYAIHISSSQSVGQTPLEGNDRFTEFHIIYPTYQLFTSKFTMIAKLQLRGNGKKLYGWGHCNVKNCMKVPQQREG